MQQQISVSQPMHAYLSIRTDAPPHMPPPASYAHLPVNIQQWIPTIAAAAANEIQRAAAQQSNPIRMAAFNIYARDQFRNPEFEFLVIAIGEYLTLGQVKRAFADPGTVINSSVEQIVRYLSGLVAAGLPGMQQMVDYNTWGQVQRDIQDWNRIYSEIQTLKAGGQVNPAGMMPAGQPQQSWTFAPGVQAQGMNFGSGYSQNFGNMGGGQAGFFQQPGRSGGLNLPPGQVGSSSVGAKYDTPVIRSKNFTPVESDTGFAPQPSAAAAPFPAGGDSFVLMATPAGPSPAPAPLESAALDSNEIPAAGNWHRWRPSADYPYPPAFKSGEEELFFQFQPNGTIKPILRKRSTTMDAAVHSTATVFGLKPPGLAVKPVAQVLAQIEEGTKEMVAQLQDLPARERAEEEKIVLFVDEQYMPVFNEETALFLGRMRRLEVNHEKLPFVFRAYANVSQPVACEKDENDLIKKYAGAGTFEKLQEYLNEDSGKISAELWNVCNDKITRVVNRVLQQNLTIPSESLHIESFASDAKDLIEALGRSFGVAVQRGFLKHQAKIIMAVFQPADEQARISWNNDFVADLKLPEGVTAAVTYVASLVTFTYLDCNVYELGVDLAPNVGSVIYEDQAPVIYKVIASIFDDEMRANVPHDRHLIVLNDGRVLEAAQGYLMEAAYLLKLVK